MFIVYPTDLLLQIGGGSSSNDAQSLQAGGRPVDFPRLKVEEIKDINFPKGKVEDGQRYLDQVWFSSSSDRESGHRPFLLAKRRLA